MVISLEINLADTARQVDSLQAALERQQPRLLAAIGRELVSAARRDFATKSRGGTGEDGERWRPLTPAERRRKARLGQAALGRRTGTLGDPANVVATTNGPNAFGKLIGPDEVAIDYTDQPKANFFSFHRPLLQRRLPNAWYRRVDAIVQAGVNTAVGQAFSS